MTASLPASHSAAPEPKILSPLRLARERRGLTLKELAAELNAAAIARDGAAALKWDNAGLSRGERLGVRSIQRAADLVAFFGNGRGGITEIDLLYPERWPTAFTPAEP